MSRYPGDSFRWRHDSGGRGGNSGGRNNGPGGRGNGPGGRGNGRGGRGNDAAGHHWPAGGPGNQGYPGHNYHMMPDPYMSFEQQPTWTPNSLMPWLQQEQWGWQQLPQPPGFVPGGTNFSKPPPKTHPEQQLLFQKQPKGQKHNKQQQNLQQQNQQQQQQQQQKKQLEQQRQQQQQKKQQPQKKQQQQPQKKQQQQQQQQQPQQQQERQQQQQQKQQQQQTKANVEKKAGGNQLQKTENSEKPNPPLGSEEARRKALESTTDKLKRCLSSMGQERTEVLETLLDEAAPAADVAKVVAQEEGHSEGLGPMVPAVPPEPEIRLSPADWRRIALSSQKTPAAVEEDDVVFVSAPAPEMVAIEDSSDDESHTGKAVDPTGCKSKKQENMSAICKTEPEPEVNSAIAEDCEHHTHLEDNTSNDLQPGDETNVLKMNVNTVAVNNTFVNKDGLISPPHVEPVKAISHDKETPGKCETMTDKLVRENVSDPKKTVSRSEFEHAENTEANVNAVTDVGDSAIPKAQNTTPTGRLRHSSESCSSVPAHPRTRSASLQSPPPLPTTEPRVRGDSVDSLKRNVMRKLLAMSAASVRDIVDNPTQSRRVQHALCHLVNEHRTAWTRHMRRLAEVRFRRDCSSTVQSLEPPAPPDLEADADAAVDLASLPPELIERLGDLLQLDGLGTNAEGMDPGISDDGLEELQELQEALCRQSNVERVPEKDLSDLLPGMKQENGAVKEELEEEMDRFDASTDLDSMRVTEMTATEPNSSDPPTEFGSLFCDFPDFSSDLDRASNCSLPMPLSDNLATALQTSERLQETSPTIEMTRDLQSDLASTVADSGTHSVAMDSSKNAQTVQIPDNDSSTQEASVTGENLGVTLCDDKAGASEKDSSGAMMSEQAVAPNAVASVTSNSVMTKESDDSTSSKENHFSNNNYVDRMCRIRTLAARKEYKTNESPIDTGTQTEDSSPVEPYTLLQLLQNKFNIPVDVIQTVRPYLTHSNSSGNSRCKSQPNLHTDSIVDYSGCDLEQSVFNSFQTDDTVGSKKSVDTEQTHLLPEQEKQTVLGDSCNISCDPHAAVHSDQINAEAEENTERQNDQVLPHTSSEDSSNILQLHNKISYPSTVVSDKPQLFHKRKVQKQNLPPINFRFVSKSPLKKRKALHNKSIQPYSSHFHSKLNANRNLDAVTSRSVPEENNSLTQALLPHTRAQTDIPHRREQVNTLTCMNNMTTGANLPVNMSSPAENLSATSTAEFNISASGNIFKQMFDIDNQVTLLMQRKLELYKLLEGASVTSRSQLTNNSSATDDSALRINTSSSTISKKAWKRRQRMIRKKLSRVATSVLTASNAMSEDNTNPMPVLESAVMDVPNAQNVLGSQTIPVLHREETVVMRTEQNPLESCVDHHQNTDRAVESCEMHLETPATNTSDDPQLLTVTHSNLESSEVVTSENTIPSKPSVEDEVNPFACHAENHTLQSKEDTLNASPSIDTVIEITGTLYCLDAQDNQTSLGTDCENIVATNEDVSQVVSQPIVPKRSGTSKSKRQKGRILSQEPLNEGAAGFQNDNRLTGAKEISLSREPVVKLVDISEVSMKTRRKSTVGSTVKQDASQESVTKAKENNIGGAAQEMFSSESDEVIKNTTVEEEEPITPTCVNKRGRTKPVTSKSSNNKKLKATVKADADVCGGNKNETEKGDPIELHSVESPEAKSDQHTSEQVSDSSNTATTNKLPPVINMEENSFYNYRSTRRKRHRSLSASLESSVEWVMANMDYFPSVAGNKRRRGRSSAAVLNAEEAEVSEFDRPKEKRKPRRDPLFSVGKVDNTENNSRFPSAAAEVKEGNNSDNNWKSGGDLKESKRKLPLPKKVSFKETTETQAKSRGKPIDSEVKLQKPDTEKKSTPTAKTAMSDTIEFGTSSEDTEKCNDVLQEAKRKSPLLKKATSTKKTGVHLKSRGKAADSLGEKSTDSLGEKSTDSLGEKSTDSLGEKSTDSLGEKSADSLEGERDSPILLSFESDTDSLPGNRNQIARKRSVTFNRRKGQKKAVPDLVIDISQDDENVTVQSDTSSPQNRRPIQTTSDRLPADVTFEDTLRKEKEEKADGERNQLPINSKSWRMRAVSQIRQCEVRLERLTDAEVRAASEGTILEICCDSHGTASDESDIDSESDLIIYHKFTPSEAAFSPIVLDEGDPSDTASGEGTPHHEHDHEHDHEHEGRRVHLILVGHTGAILEIVTVGRQAVGACEDGFVYCYSLKSGRLKRVVGCGDKPVTCLCVVETAEDRLIFAGSLDGHMRCFSFKDGTHIFEAVDVGAPIQCIDQNWGNVYMGNMDGTIGVFNIETRELKDPRLSCTDEPILSLKTTKEGPRQVLLVACRNQPLSIRDAKTGLLMRTVSYNSNGSVYCTLLDSSLIYCGTSNGRICVHEFTTGAEVYRLTAGVGVVVCLRLYRNLLFAGCYDGIIYVYNLQDKALISRFAGPGKMIFCLEVVKNRVIASSKTNNKLVAWSFPPEIRKYLRDIRHR